MKSYQNFLISIILIFAIIPVFTLGQSVLDLPKPGLTPNSPFYFIDTLFEKISLTFTFNVEKKIQKAIRYSEEKLAEIKIMIEENKTESIEKATSRYQKVLNSANQKSQEAEGENGNTGETSGLIVETEAKYQIVLENFLEEASEQNQSTIQAIIETSKTNQDQILENIPEDKKIEIIDKINQLEIRVKIEQEIIDTESKAKEANKEVKKTESKIEELNKKVEETKDESEKAVIIDEIEKTKNEVEELKKESDKVQNEVEIKKQEILEPEPVLGCTDSSADNYNSVATDDNNSCVYPEPKYLKILGCTDTSADNYNSAATDDNNSCTYSEPEPEPEPDICDNINCAIYQYCNDGVCYNYCQGTDDSCGGISCKNCNESDRWIDLGSSYSCCDENKSCVCQQQEYRDYYCLGTSCSYSITDTRINRSNYIECDSSESCSNGVCINVCSSNCVDKNCGSDGCGGNCGSCSDSQICSDGICTDNSSKECKWTWENRKQGYEVVPCFGDQLTCTEETIGYMGIIGFGCGSSCEGDALMCKSYRIGSRLSSYVNIYRCSCE